MATDTAMKARELQVKQDIADKDRAQRDKESKRNVVTSILSSFMPRGKFTIPFGKDNDPAWYKVFINSDVNTAIPDFIIQGNVYNEGAILNSDNPISTLSYSDSEAIQRGKPIVYTVKYHDAFGIQDAKYMDNPLNEGWVKFKAELDKRNSVTGAYEASDIGLYVIGAVSAAQLIMRIQIAIQAYEYYVSTSKAEAPALIRALGFDFNNFKDHVKEYRTLVAECVEIFNQHIALPADITYTARKLWLSCSVFEDTDRGIGALVVYTPTNYWCLDDTTTHLNPVLLNYVPGAYTNGVYSTISNMIRQMMRRLREPKSLQRMNADIRAGVSKFVQLPLVMDKPLELTNTHYAHMQFENLDTLPAICYDSSYVSRYRGLPTSSMNDVIYSDANGYLWHGEVDSAGYADTTAPFKYFLASSSIDVLDNLVQLTDLVSYLYLQRFNEVDRNFTLNFHSSKINGDDILEATRLKCEYLIDSTTSGPGGQAGLTYEPYYVGTEAVMYVEAYTYQGDDIYQATPLSTSSLLFSPTPAAATITNLLMTAVNSQSIDKTTSLRSSLTYPFISRIWNAVVDQNGQFANTRLLHQYQNDEHLLPLQRELLERLHRQCLLSLFVLPKPGKNTY